ncbi:hypothetical protein Plhal304r1_c019g0066201 [Plasmopara halstedii]
MSTSRHHVVSVVLGSDATQYESSSTAMNQFAGKRIAGLTMTATENVNKECHVQFGEPGSKRDFSTSSKLADPAGGVQRYKGELLAEAKEMLLRTSSCFGKDIVPYISSTHLAMQWDKKKVEESIRLRNEIRARTGPQITRGMSYDDDIEYVSEAKSSFKNQFELYKPSIMAATVKNDLSATHFSMGHEKLDYKTSNYIKPMSSEQFAAFSIKPPPTHDLKMSNVVIS